MEAGFYARAKWRYRILDSRAPNKRVQSRNSRAGQSANSRLTPTAKKKKTWKKKRSNPEQPALGSQTLDGQRAAQARARGYDDRRQQSVLFGDKTAGANLRPSPVVALLVGRSWLGVSPSVDTHQSGDDGDAESSENLLGFVFVFGQSSS